ncbi:CRP-like cAMP-binding protein [Sphingomonas sp. SORGH_AS870]|uniref:Crp/Fnr family transcriptional regulator n=1 Tax=Sphingomonas sp. SORGH_AS_0870 TaxID=3041801 RepID=UPI002856E93E|nr:Crp/Fnr family transcriptional regulator [Sphingomonas sp. SORGH_AS_0870]MDR6147954.1 CRP-like cAMP-binding protein [Sphingomonas sp. SORGH_AS_0870]
MTSTSLRAEAMIPTAEDTLSTAALRRLSALTPLDEADLALLRRAAADPTSYPVRHTFLTIGRPVAEPMLLLQGWAARVRILPDGRRQFMSFYLPGDVIGRAHHPMPLASATVVAITECVVCPAPAAPPGSGLAQAYAIGEALEEAYLLGHVVQLGRLNAQERIGDFLLEIYERLSLAGLTVGGSFEMPLTQEMLADALGLTPVHVNRMIQQARRDGELMWKSGRILLRDPDRTARTIGRISPQVSGAPHPAQKPAP